MITAEISMFTVSKYASTYTVAVLSGVFNVCY